MSFRQPLKPLPSPVRPKSTDNLPMHKVDKEERQARGRDVVERLVGGEDAPRAKERLGERNRLEGRLEEIL